MKWLILFSIRSVSLCVLTLQSDDNEMSKAAFMAEIERDAARRADERKQRESVAQNLRK